MNASNKKIPTTLAIDFGTVRVGLAVSRASLAEPLEIFPNDDKLLSRLYQLIQDQNIDQVVVGISEAEMAEKTKAFVAELNQVLNDATPIEFADETLSSKETHQKMRAAGVKKQKRQAPIDHYAAASFLQDWLDLKYH